MRRSILPAPRLLGPSVETGHESKWVRGEVLGCNVVDMTTSVFLVDYGVMVTQPINNFYRIPERIQAPMVSFIIH